MERKNKNLFWKRKNEDFIGHYKIDTSICRKLIKEFDNKKTKQPGVVGEQKHDPKSKMSLDYGINPEDLINPGPIKEYFEELSFCLNKYKKEYIYSNTDQERFILEGANIQKYKPGEGFYKWHFENNGRQHSSGRRHLVFMTYLNTVRDGGTNFYYQNKITEAKIGSTVIWPAAWTHTHSGQINKKQTKYIITGWWWYVSC